MSTVRRSALPLEDKNKKNERKCTTYGIRAKSCLSSLITSHFIFHFSLGDSFIKRKFELLDLNICKMFV
jgi:hypothetical protein